MTKTFGVEAIRDFEHDLERALDDLRVAVDRVVDADADVEDDILTVDDKDVAHVNASELTDLLERLGDAPGEVASAFEDFTWKFHQALRAFRQAALCPRVED